MRVNIDGMHCDACVRRVRKALENTQGVAVRDVKVGWADVSVDAAQEAAMLEAVRQAVRQAGYEPHKV